MKQIIISALVLCQLLSTQMVHAHQGPINPSGVEFSGQDGPCAIREVIDPLNLPEGLNCDLGSPNDPFGDDDQNP